MRFSLKWLGDFIEVEPFFKNPQVLLESLAQAGLEVDSFEEEDRFKNCVIAQIVSVKKHPQADRLKICKVTSGESEHSVVCGAKNYKEGDKVVLAKPGAILPGNWTIKKSRIRGVVSEGMLASRTELGFLPRDQEKTTLKSRAIHSSDGEEGIWILPFDAAVGISLSEYLSCEADVIFDLSVPPNRPDCLSHKGLAREIHYLLECSFVKMNSHTKGHSMENGRVKPITKDFVIQEDKLLSVKETIKVEVKDDKACSRYCGRLITGLKIAESPSWLKSRLHSLGLKSINNVVDVTNFVLWDRGQPLHAFDRDKIQSLTVDLSKKGEHFLSLDHQKITLNGGELTIRDGDKILALAGIIGGMDSCVTKDTQNIFIESASFSPEKIRRSTRGLGIETNSSYRFSRGIDIHSVKESMDLACFLIQKLAGGQVSRDYYDIYKFKIQIPSIKIGLDNLEDRIGYKVSSFEFQSQMEKVQCKVKAFKGLFEVNPPSYRQDLQIKEDVIEEFARLKGYHKIPETPAPSISSRASDPHFLMSQRIIRFLSGKGWYQALNYSFCDPDYYKNFLTELGFLEDFALCPSMENHKFPISKSSHCKKVFFVDNPISRHLSLMKPLLIPDLVKNVVYNFRYNNKVGQIFELSPVFYNEGDNNYKQEFCLGLALWGKPIDIWKNQEVPNVYHIKSILEILFQSLRLKSVSWEKAKISFLHPHQSLALIAKDQVLGFLGSLHPRFNKKNKIPLDIALAEIRIEALEQIGKNPVKFKPFSKLLSLERDLCFLVPKEVAVEEVKQEMKKTLGASCGSIEIFDVYERFDKNQREDSHFGERSVSFRINLIPQERSWTDQELQDILTKLIQSVRKKFSVCLWT